MTGHDSHQQRAGRITDGLEQDTLVDKTLAFVHQRLPEWRDDPDRTEEQSENRLNLQLCKFLDARARSDFPMVCFHHEEYQPGRRRVDLSATPAEATTIDARDYTIYSPFIVFEGKRLPAPSADRKMEYVTSGESRKGGIQRFKLGLHGAELPVAAMIGYVQEQSSSHWHQLINEWISDLAAGRVSDVCPWKAAETLGHLEQDARKGIAACESTHERSGDVKGNSIQLHHLWVEMAASKAAK
ncbi:MAG: hypothetical protein V3R99_08145 [Thermoguttaceae bacterium]